MRRVDIGVKCCVDAADGGTETKLANVPAGISSITGVTSTRCPRTSRLKFAAVEPMFVLVYFTGRAVPQETEPRTPQTLRAVQPKAQNTTE